MRANGFTFLEQVMVLMLIAMVVSAGLLSIREFNRLYGSLDRVTKGYAETLLLVRTVRSLLHESNNGYSSFKVKSGPGWWELHSYKTTMRFEKKSLVITTTGYLPDEPEKRERTYRFSSLDFSSPAFKIETKPFQVILTFQEAIGKTDAVVFNLHSSLVHASE